MSTFKILLTRAQEGGYVVSCPALPGCSSQGETKKEAMQNIREATALYIETLNDRSHHVPKNCQVFKVTV